MTRNEKLIADAQALVERTTKAQGLPVTVEDLAALDTLATLLQHTVLYRLATGSVPAGGKDA